MLNWINLQSHPEGSPLRLPFGFRAGFYLFRIQTHPGTKKPGIESRVFCAGNTNKLFFLFLLIFVSFEQSGLHIGRNLGVFGKTKCVGCTAAGERTDSR